MESLGSGSASRRLMASSFELAAMSSSGVTESVSTPRVERLASALMRSGRKKSDAVGPWVAEGIVATPVSAPGALLTVGSSCMSVSLLARKHG